MLDTHAADASRLAPGTRLGGIYEIDQRIASGGMGDIYRGHAIETGAQVAIKVIRTDLADNDMALPLFRREAIALNDIQHEAIVRYYVFANDPGTGRYYLAMEFVDGQPLSEILRDGPLSFESVRLLQQRLAAGLHAAHKHGIIHRDVSPDNVLVPGGDCSLAKIIDFGIARDTRVGDGTIIGSGFAGKYNYVSPEQLGLYGDVTPKSDIYSLGLVLAQALTGQPIDMGGSQVAIVEKRRVVPDLRAIDARFRPLIEKMLQPNPADRPESMAAVAAWAPGNALSAADRNAAVSRDRVRTMPRRATGVVAPDPARKWRAGVLALLLLAGTGGAGFYLLKEQIFPPVPPPPEPPIMIPSRPENRTAEEERRQAELKRIEDQRRQAEAKRIEDERKQAEAKRIEDERRQAEAKRIEDERRQAEAKHIEDERRQAEAKRIEDERRQAEAKRIEDERKLAETKRIEDERKQAELKRIEDERKLAETKRIEDQRRQAELKRIEDERKLAETKRIEDERKQAELKRIEDERKLAETKRIEDERKQAELKRIEDERKLAEAKRIEDERKQAELKRIEDERKLAEAKRIEDERKQAELKRIEDERKLAETKRIEDERKQAELKRIEDERKLAETKRIEDERKQAELKRIEDERKLAEGKRIEDERKQAELKRIEDERRQAELKGIEDERRQAELKGIEDVVHSGAAPSAQAPVPSSKSGSPPEQGARFALASPQSMPEEKKSGPAAPAEGLIVKEQIDQERIKKAQKELIRLGCYDGSPDGNLNDTTRAAVRKFWQKSKQRVGEVKITDDLIAQLEQHLDSLCKESPPAPPPPVGRGRQQAQPPQQHPQPPQQHLQPPQQHPQPPQQHPQPPQQQHASRPAPSPASKPPARASSAPAHSAPLIGVQ